MEETSYRDEIGRMSCQKELYHESCFDFDDANHNREEDVRFRKPEKTALEEAAERLVECNIGENKNQESCNNNSNDKTSDHVYRIAAQKQWEELSADADPKQVKKAIRKAIEKEKKRNADFQAVVAQAWAKKLFGDAETQKLYDESAAVSTESNDDIFVDKYTCSYCEKTSKDKLQCCSRCKVVFYCGRDCQKKAWKAHKRSCTPLDGELKSIKMLSWEQVEAHGGSTVMGKTLEVRVILDESLIRQVFRCKDRLGVVYRIAAYTNSGRIPGLKQGVILRWKNPRFHYFMDGSKGARIEEDDLPNISIL